MKNFFFISLFFVPFVAFSQLGLSPMNSSSSNWNTDVDISLGTSFISDGSGGSLLNHYAFPKLTLSPSDKFDLNVGVLMMNTRSNGFNSASSYGLPMQQNVFGQSSLNQSYIYGSGRYHVNEKLTISGGGFKKVSSNYEMQQVNPQVFNFDAYGMNVGMEYRPSENTRISTEFHFQQGYDPMNPFQNSYQYQGMPWMYPNGL
jgi:hypothetical protein